MTSTPGPTPGTSDSAEPDDGESSAPAQPGTRSDDTAGTPEAAAGTPEAAAGTGTGERGGEAAVDSQDAAEDPESGTRWAQEQPPPTSEGWAAWAQPPSVPQQGGRRWGGPHGGKAQSNPHQDPAQHGRPHNGQGPYPGAGWGRQGWQPPQAGRQPQPGQPATWGWAQPRPQAPKPGVIPLRPLGMGEILDGTIASFRKHWRSMLGVTLAFGVLTQGLDIVVRHQLTDTKALDDLQNDPQPTFSETMHVMGNSLTSSGLMLLITLIGTMLSSALLTIPISRAVLGRGLRAGDMWRDARVHVPRAIGLALLIPLIAVVLVGIGAMPGLLVTAASDSSAGPNLVGLGVLAALVVFVWVYFQLSLSAPALVLEKQSVVAAMKRSWKLVRGSWWRMLGIQVMAMVLASIVGMVIQLPFLLIAQALAGDGTSSLLAYDAGTEWTNLIPVAVGGVLSAAITLPLTAGVPAFLYLDQRIRRESLDIELARAATQN